MSQKIQVLMPGGEAREDKLRRAIEKDKQKRFEWSGNSSEIPGDAQFSLQITMTIESNGIMNPGRIGFRRPYQQKIGSDKVFNLEIKAFTGKADDNSDLLGTILSGHGLLQTFKLRKAGHPCAFVILGNEEDLKNACMKSAYHRGLKGDAATDLMITYENMVYDFEAKCRGQNIGFWWFKSVPFKRILSNVYYILTESDLSSYAPKPMDGEEQAVALSLLVDGIGPTKAKSILEKFEICLEPRKPCTFLDDCDGIGQKLAEGVGKAIKINPDMITRPKVKRPRKAAKAACEAMT